jgi:hypothetical protein
VDRKPRYCVTGLDTDGDRHTFETDDPARAEATLYQFAEDLRLVWLSDRQAEERGPTSDHLISMILAALRPCA